MILKLTWKTDEFWSLAYRARGSWRKHSDWGVAQVRVHDPLHPSFFDRMSTVTKFYLDGLLQVGTAGLMQTVAVLRVQQQ